MARLFDCTTGQWRNFENLEVAWQNGPTYRVSDIPAMIRVWGNKDARTVTFQYATKDPETTRQGLGIEIYGFWMAFGALTMKFVTWLASLM